jgi:large subunit ribosomal protein L6
MLPLLLPLLLCSAFSCVLQVEKNTTLIIGSANKEQLGAYCAEIRRQRPPEPYKGKGIRYAGEVIKLKEGKGGGKKK